MKDIILFGIQWSGKGTQADLILQNNPDVFSYVSTGNIFRALTKGQDNALGRYVHDIINAGKLVNDKVTNSIFQAYFYSVLDQQKYMLIDWYPRTIDQLDDIFRLAELEGRELLGIQFDIPDEVALERMQSRWREDDTPESIKTRIASYYESTVPVIEHFTQHADMQLIDATQSIEDIAAEVSTYLG